MVSVLLFAATSVTHALAWRGLAWTATLILVATGGGLLVQAVGVRTRIPFGTYTYSDSLGWKLFGVPAVIPLAWTMMAYLALLVARRITTDSATGPLVAGAALASWDLFLDPQIVGRRSLGVGAWRRAEASGIPVSNFVGRLDVSVLMMALLCGRCRLAWTPPSTTDCHAASICGRTARRSSRTLPFLGCQAPRCSGGLGWALWSRRWPAYGAAGREKVGVTPWRMVRAQGDTPGVARQDAGHGAT